MKAKNPSNIIQKSKTEEIKSLASKIVSSKKHCNSVVKIFEFLLEENCSIELHLACIRAIHKIFCFYLEQNDVQHISTQGKSDSPELKLREWLRERYIQSVDVLLGQMQHEDSAVKELALCTLMKFLASEGIKPMDGRSKVSFPMGLFENIVSSLLNSVDEEEELINRFQEYLEYDDVRYNYMKRLMYIITSIQESSSEVSEVQISNLLSGMLILTSPSGSEKLSNFLVASSAGSSLVSSVKVHREMFSKVWLAFVKIKLTSKMYKKILVSLPDKIIPHLQDPLVVSDWLISCYDRGGALSLMSLNGLFVLMNKYNLEYPDFYNRLYNIMDNEVFFVKYKARFFHMLDLFLQSLLLPTTTIAAFIKKLSRMALTAPPHGILLILELVTNLLVRHDTCRTLVHRDTSCSFDTDPYIPDESDINKCNAVDSSLWEIKSLQKHWHHQIASQALRIEKPLPHIETPFVDVLEVGYDELMGKEVKKSKKDKAKEANGQVNVPITHVQRTKLFSFDDADLETLWITNEV
ncbi:nucleolar complex protein 4 homolog [Watersipora subatra]|uniref:nucleolar complex protein 4 homolog n=1 Tax=Watersipora subatra TaxID=2589382 RepID=UPI00355BDF2A